MFVPCHAMEKMGDFMINVFKQCPRGYIEGGYYFFTRPLTAGIIRMWVLFEGGPYMRKYGNHPILSPICPMGVADTLEHGLNWPLFIIVLDFLGSISRTRFFNWFFVCFKLDIYCLCSVHIACKSQARNNQKIKFKNQVQKSIS